MKRENLPAWPIDHHDMRTLERETGGISASSPDVDAARGVGADVQSRVLNHDLQSVRDVAKSAGTSAADEIVAKIDAFRSRFRAGEFPMIVQGNGPLDVLPWVRGLRRISYQVCRIIGPGSTGTGFLIEADLVLTAYHVVADLFGDGAADRYEVIFDHQLLDDRRSYARPRSCRLNPRNPLGADFSQKDLDYAVLRLNERVGDDLLDGEKRGWTNFPQRDPVLPADLFLGVVHSPLNSHIYFSPGAFLNEDVAALRVRYVLNTGGGSSGAPVFNADWELIAVHNDAENVLIPTFGIGVPAYRIKKHMSGATALSRSPIDLAPVL